MENQSDSTSILPPKKAPRFAPKMPRKRPKSEVVKTEASETNDDFIDKELLSKLNNAKSHEGFGRRVLKTDKKIAPAQVAFGYGDTSKARSFGNPKGFKGKYQDELDASAPAFEKEYVEPWDYHHSNYPTTLPLRRPHSGNPEILDKKEFGEEALFSSAIDEARINPAEELGLMEETVEPQMIFFQLPPNLPLPKRPAAATDSKAAGGKADVSKKGCKLEDLPAGFMGKMLVYKSGIVKMKLGDALFDVAPAAKSLFAQDVAAINPREKHCCNLGELNKRAVMTPDVDHLLSSIEDMDV